MLRAFTRYTGIGLLLVLATCRDASGPDAGPFDVAVVGFIGEMTIVPDADGWPEAYCDIQLTAQTTGQGNGVWDGAVFRWFMGIDRNAVAAETRPARDLV